MYKRQAGAAGAALVVAVLQLTAAGLAGGGASPVEATGGGIRAALLVATALTAGVVALALMVGRPDDQPATPAH